MEKQNFESMLEAFTLGTDCLKEIARNFQEDLEAGLENPQNSSLRMLKSYVGLPESKEKGEFLALDFGGTNVRVLRIRLEGDGKYTVVKKVAKPLVFPGLYDFIGAEASAEDLFDFIAGLAAEAIEDDPEVNYLLGHTFSFPSEQTDLYNARLIVWTKEFATQGVAGEIVNDLLRAALVRNDLSNIQPVAVINDTVAVLLAAAYKNPATYIGSIYATGHNTCYLEPAAVDSKPMILNLESGGFSKLQTNSYDQILDQASERPGEQCLEKMVSGRYMGELFSLCFKEQFPDVPQASFTSIDLSAILEDQDLAGTATIGLIESRTGHKISAGQCERVKQMASVIVKRSARLVAATYAGILLHLDGQQMKPQQVAVDGSVYEKVPGAAKEIRLALQEILGTSAKNVEFVLENGGSGLGAAIAAAVAPAICGQKE